MFTAKRERKVFIACLLWSFPGVVWGEDLDRPLVLPSDTGLSVIREFAPSRERAPALAQRLRRPDAEEPEVQAPTAEPPQPAEKQPPEAVPPLPLPGFSPPGFAGRYFLLPRGAPPSPDFIPIEDRWRLGFPEWNRYDRPLEAPYVKGHWWDPYNQNVLKGDYPILGQHIFMNVSAISDTLFEARRIPLPSNASSAAPSSAEFFGTGDQLLLNQNFILSVEVFKGDTAFKPRDWEIRATPVFNVTYLDAKETGVVDIDVTQGTTRKDSYISFQELFAEYHLADLSPNYDFISARGGIQGFTSDFRGFIFSDNQLGFRLFGNLESNRNQFNVVYFRPLEKDTNSGLNRLFKTRGQDLAIVNYFRQDFIWPGYTVQLSLHYLHDAGGSHVDNNGFVVRPAVAGVPELHTIDATYLGWSGDGHIGPVNLTHAFYYVFGADSFNSIAARRQEINAQMVALELSTDLDWLRPKLSLLWASGDGNPRDKYARGFDAIFDNPNFAGGGFSYWVRQGIPLTSTNLQIVGRNSLLPSLRSSKIEGQPNFVNPGLFLLGIGADIEITPRLRASVNVNFLRFHQTQALSLLLFQPRIRHDIGIDSSLGLRYRPFLNENFLITVGGGALSAGKGLKDVYTNETFIFSEKGLELVKNKFPYGTLYSAFMSLTLTY